MGPSMDFLKYLDTDTSLIIMNHLDAPADLVRASAVSHTWRDFVIKHELGKQLSLKKYPQLSCVAQVALVSEKEVSGDIWSSSSMIRDSKEMDHIVYASLAHLLDSATKWSCIAEAICASSTDHHPQESIDNTLIPSDRTELRASYWSSTGRSDADVPESLIYKLHSNLCLVNEIYVQPFQDYFQLGYPIYSSKLVRFWMGYPKCPLYLDSEVARLDELTDDDFVWTYKSPEFPMLQEGSLQKFQLTEPALCIGGFLKIELLGRVQKHEMDHLYYVCVSHVRAHGMPLSPKFNVKTSHNSGKFVLEYDPHAVIIPPSNTCTSIIEFIDEVPEIMHWGQLINMNDMNQLVQYMPWMDEEDESEDEHIHEHDIEDVDEDGDGEVL